MLLRSCVAQALSRGDGPRYLLHASVQCGEYNEDLIYFSRLTMLTLLFMFYFFYIGLEISFSSYLFTFGLTDAPGMKLSKEFSVYLNSAFYFSVVLGQFCAIFLSKIFPPTRKFFCVFYVFSYTYLYIFITVLCIVALWFELSGALALT